MKGNNILKNKKNMAGKALPIGLAAILVAGVVVSPAGSLTSFAEDIGESEEVIDSTASTETSTPEDTEPLTVTGIPEATPDASELEPVTTEPAPVTTEPAPLAGEMNFISDAEEASANAAALTSDFEPTSEPEEDYTTPTPVVKEALSSVTFEVTGIDDPVEYDGQYHNIEYDETTIPVGGEEVTVVAASCDDENSYYVAGLSALELSVKNASDCGTAIELSAEQTANLTIFDASYESVNIGDGVEFKVKPGNRIAKKRLTLKSANIAKPYDGAPLTNGDEPLEVEEGWVNGEGATYSFTAQIIEVGAVPNNFDIIPNEGTDLNNYDYSPSQDGDARYGKTSGTLEIVDRMDDQKYTLTVTGLSDTFKYDGQKHEVNGFIAEGRSGTEFRVSGNGNPDESISFTIGNATFNVSGITAHGEGVNAGTYEVVTTGTPVVTDAFGNVVTTQFNFEFTAGIITIEKRNITFTSASDKKKYDGEFLENDEVKISGEGFVSGEGATFKVKGKQKIVGVSYNYFDYKMNEGTLESNYNVTKVPGKLTVTKADKPKEDESKNNGQGNQSGSGSSDSAASNISAPATTPTQDAGEVLGVKKNEGTEQADDATVLGARRSATDDSTDSMGRILFIMLSMVGVLTILFKGKKQVNG